jgi:hypothetical protein
MSHHIASLELLQTDASDDDLLIHQRSRPRDWRVLPLAAGLVLGLVALLGVGSSLGKTAAVTEAAELSAADCKQSCIVASAKLSQCMSNCSTDCSKCKPLQIQATNCYNSCDPRERCTGRCHDKYDSSCMQSCSAQVSKCMSSRCLRASDYGACEQNCMLAECGQQCLATTNKLQTCVTQCYNVASAVSSHVPEVDTSSMAHSEAPMTEEGRCHQNCGKKDLAENICMKQCMPEVQQCMTEQCTQYGHRVPEAIECAQTCQKTCADSCSQRLQDAQSCHQSCEPADRTNCLNGCQRSHDVSCMDSCSFKMERCSVNCTATTQSDRNAFSNCQQRCSRDICGSDCVEAAQKAQSCFSGCYQQQVSVMA